MRSAAHVKGHPVHPMLIPFPIAFIAGALVFDLLALMTGRPPFAATAAHLAAAGVAMGAIAAIPGLIDYLYTVPPRSSGKTRATRHAVVNGTALLLAAIAWLTRDQPPSDPALATVALESGAALLIAAGGWMGGVLVTRNQISVDHRYANAGAWKEAVVQGASVDAGATGELAASQMKLLHAGSRRVVLARDDAGYVAFDDRCPHRGGSLAGGAMICRTVQCPWHGSQFDVRTGAVRAGPATQGIATFETSVTQGRVRVTF